MATRSDKQERYWLHRILPLALILLQSSQVAWAWAVGDPVGRTLNAGISSLVWTMAWSPDGKRLACSYGRNLVLIWEPATGKEIKRFATPDGIVDALNWTPRRLASAVYSEDLSSISVWSILEGKRLYTLRPREGKMTVFGWSPDGRWLAVSSDGALKLWDSKGVCVSTLSLPRGQGVSCIAWSPDSKFVAGNSSGDELWIWSRSSGEIVRRLQETPPGHDHFTEPHAMDWSRDGKWLAALGPVITNRPIRLWYLPAFRKETEVRLRDEESSVYAMAWSPDSKHLAVSTNQGVWVCRRSDGKRVLEKEIGAHALAWKPKGSILAVGDADGAVHLWDMAKR